MGIDIGGALIAAGGDLLGGATSAIMARNAYQHRYQDTVKDLTAAGLNPALAYGVNPGGGAQTPDLSNLGSSAMRGASAMADAKQREANTALTWAQADLLKRQADDLAQTPRIRNIAMTRGYELMQTRQDLAEQEYNFRGGDKNAIGTYNTLRANEMAARIAATLANKTATEQGIELQKLSFPEAQALANFYRGPMGKASPYIDQGGAILRAIGQIWPRINIGGPPPSSAKGFQYEAGKQPFQQPIRTTTRYYK